MYTKWHFFRVQGIKYLENGLVILCLPRHFLALLNVNASYIKIRSAQF